MKSSFVQVEGESAPFVAAKNDYAEFATFRLVSYICDVLAFRGSPLTELSAMQVLPCCAAAMAVAIIFYGWRAWWRVRMRLLRERVTYMLWIMARQQDGPQPTGTTGEERKIVTI